MMLGEFRSARLAATFAFSRWASGKDGTGPELSAAAATCAKSWPDPAKSRADFVGRSEEHTSELQSLMRISYAVFCLKKKEKNTRFKSYSLHYTHFRAHDIP